MDNTFDIIINGKKFEYITSKKIDGVNYVAYADENNIYISKFTISNNQINLEPINEELIDSIKEVMNLE